MALTNLAGWTEENTASACGAACGASDKPAETPAACGASDKPAEAPAACGASNKPEEKPAACGSACGAGDK
ncbi:MAG: ACGX-repeat peptide [Lachnospiraceae bacterium]|nr:ACGX-repeat peptide [Lachnospiraceae bacterium]